MSGFSKTVSIFAFFLIHQGCELPQDFNPPGDNMSGMIIMADTNLITDGGYYAVSIFSADSTSPFSRVPYLSDSLSFYIRYGVYQSNYDVSGIGSGKYYVACTWMRYPHNPHEIPIVLATYGCDTLSNCTSHKVIYYPNYEGVYRNIISWTDTAKGIN